MNINNCPCGTGLPYENCCGPYHAKIQSAPTAVTLMRSRYTAFVVANAEYLYETTHISKRKGNTKNAYLQSAKNTKWVKLEIISAGFDTVTFKAYYLNSKFQTEVLHEQSNFSFVDGKWYYVDGVFY